jgi:hypothetical protein
MSNAIVVASGAADAQAVTGPAVLVGYSIRESAGSPAVAAVVLRDGTSAAGPLRLLVELAANQSVAGMLPAVDFADGVFVDRESGSSELVLYIGE